MIIRKDITGVHKSLVISCVATDVLHLTHRYVNNVAGKYMHIKVGGKYYHECSGWSFILAKLSVFISSWERYTAFTAGRPRTDTSPARLQSRAERGSHSIACHLSSNSMLHK